MPALRMVTDVAMDAIERVVDTNHTTLMGVVAGLVGVVGLGVAGTQLASQRIASTQAQADGNAAISALRQITDAMSVRDVHGARLPADADLKTALVDTGYLRSVPSNPTGGGAPIALDASGAPSSSPVAFVAMRLAGDGAADVCRAIGKSLRVPTADTLTKARGMGCARNGDAYAAYARID
jgi:hypothetical protein